MRFPLTMDGAAPPAPRIRTMERWRVAWHGRRDAKSAPSDVNQPQHYLESLRADAEIGQRAVKQWLHDRIEPIDREAVQILIQLDQHRRDPAIPPETNPPTDEAEPQPSSRIPSRVLKARQAATAQQAYQRWVREQREAEQRLGQLGSARHHLIESARAAAYSHAARYQRLVGLYRTALRRRDPHGPPTGPPPAVSAEPWLNGDIPLLALEIDGTLAEKYRWCFKDFAHRTSAVTLPAHDVTSNPH